MLHIINTIIASLSLGLFCMGLNFYIDLHLGYEFLSTAITLEVASVLIAVAVSKNINKLNINAFAFVTLWFLIASTYLLFVINYVTVISYIIVLLCVIVPVVLTGIFIIHGRDTMSIRTMMSSVLVGFFAAIVIAYLFMAREGIWGVFMLSSAALTLAIVLRVNISNLIKTSALCLFVGVFLFINHDSLSSQLTSWSLFDKPVAKYSLNMLHNPDKRGWSVEGTTWEEGSRVDIVSTSRSRNMGNYWAIYNANLLVPFVNKANSSVSWWNEHYPLVIFPFELKKPSKVLTISAARGADTDISQQLYGAETTSIYHDCLSLNGSSPCNNLALNTSLKNALNSDKQYDLVSFSIFNQVATPYVGASAQHEAIHTIEIFHKLYDSLSKGGLLVINTRDQVMLRKALSYVWRVLADGDEDKVINFENNIRVLELNKYSLKNDAYNYLVLVSKDGFTSEELQKMNSFIKSSPVSKIIYDSAKHPLPIKLTVSAAVAQFTKVSSREFKKLLNLEPSSIIKPDFFHLSMKLHPFVSVLSVIFLLLGLYGLIFSHRSMRRDAPDLKRTPVLSILLFQAFLCAAAFVLLLYSIVVFTSASLGYSSQYTSTLILLALAAFAIAHVFTRAIGGLSSSISRLWFYPVILLLCAVFLLVMTQDIIMLLDTGAQAVAFVLALSVAFCSGQVHHQTALFTERLYPGVWFWFWCMTSVGTVLGLILAKYILINHDLSIMVQTAMLMFVFMAVITWWCLAALQDNAEIKVGRMEPAG